MLNIAGQMIFKEVLELLMGKGIMHEREQVILTTVQQ